MSERSRSGKSAMIAAEYDIWFRQRVREAQEDPRPPLASKTVERRLATRRSAAARRKQASPVQ